MSFHVMNQEVEPDTMIPNYNILFVDEVHSGTEDGEVVLAVALPSLN